MHEPYGGYINFKLMYNKMAAIEASCQNGGDFSEVVARTGVASTDFFCVSCILVGDLKHRG
jgi:hypothetical protein